MTPCWNILWWVITAWFVTSKLLVITQQPGHHFIGSQLWWDPEGASTVLPWHVPLHRAIRLGLHHPYGYTCTMLWIGVYIQYIHSSWHTDTWQRHLYFHFLFTLSSTSWSLFREEALWPAEDHWCVLMCADVQTPLGCQSKYRWSAGQHDVIPSNHEAKSFGWDTKLDSDICLHQNLK